MSHRLFAIGLAIAISTPALAAEPPATLKDCRAITDSAQRLTCYDALPLEAPAKSWTERFGLASTPSEPAEGAISSHIAGRFEGWGPSTVFTLANGQQWRVSDGSSAYYVKQDPKVVVSRGMLGGYRLEVEGLNKVAGVKRIK